MEVIFKKLVCEKVEVTSATIVIPEEFIERFNKNYPDQNFPNELFDNNGNFIITVDVATGKIKNWPIGTEINATLKLRNSGVYYLNTTMGEREYKLINEYVPKCFDTDPDSGYGDYLLLEVNKNGVWKNFSLTFRPDLVSEAFSEFKENNEY